MYKDEKNETGMLAALDVEGNAIGILANDLYKNALSGKWRKYLSSDLLTLVSTYGMVAMAISDRLPANNLTAT